MKIIAFYLPQFHTFPENDDWWGKGFTEWTNTKKAEKLFKGHQQPNIPYKKNYYDLSQVEPMKEQAKMAKENGVHAFCFYHYWFKDGKMLMEKPVERFRDSKDIDLNYCLSWANEPWTRTWDGGDNEVIMPQEYGTEKEWMEHFEYFLTFFQDHRYMKIDNKPLLLLYRPDMIQDLDKMLKLWNKLAKKAGYSGICYIAQGAAFCADKESDFSLFNYCVEFEPGYTRELFRKDNILKNPLMAIKNIGCSSMFLWGDIKTKLGNKLKKDISKPTKIYNYDTVYKAIKRRQLIHPKMLPGFFPSWDNSPRRGIDGMIYDGSTPDKFRRYMKERIKDAREKYKTDMIFINAWNEWAEGAYLEPDERNNFEYLSALKNALMESSPTHENSKQQ